MGNMFEEPELTNQPKNEAQDMKLPDIGSETIEATELSEQEVAEEGAKLRAKIETVELRIAEKRALIDKLKDQIHKGGEVAQTLSTENAQINEAAFAVANLESIALLEKDIRTFEAEKKRIEDELDILYV